MKNISIFICFLFVLNTASSTNAQTTFGIRTGVNYAGVAFINGVLRISPDRKFGLSVSALADIKFTKIFSLQPELNFIQKGFKSSELANSGSVRFNYLEIPVHAKYSLQGGKNIKWLILMGSTLGFAINGNEENCINRNCETIDIKFGDTSGFRRIDFGVSLGGGASFGKIFTDFRVGLGLTNISKIDGPLKVKSKSLQLSVGYFF